MAPGRSWTKLPAELNWRLEPCTNAEAAKSFSPRSVTTFITPPVARPNSGANEFFISTYSRTTCCEKKLLSVVELTRSPLSSPSTR